MAQKVLIAIMLMVVSATAAASTTYTYTGNQFDEILDAAAPVGSFDTSMRVTGFFEIEHPIGPDTTFLDFSSIKNFELSDGRNVFDESTPLSFSSFFLSTDAFGRISEWGIILNRFDGHTGGQIQSFGGVVGSEADLALVSICCAPDTNDTAAVRNRSGVWVAATTPVPLPSAVTIFVPALLSLTLKRRRSKRSFYL